MTTHADPGGRRTIFDVLPKSLPRLISVGRLDINTEGLLLLTNDGGLARVLELPATGWLRRYRVRAHGRVSQDQLDRLRSGITIDGVRYGPIEARLEREQGSNVWLTFAIREGKNREVKNVLGHLGLAVNRLIRVSFGPFQLGELAEGEIEEVKTRTLREQLGERLAALAGVDFSAPRIERTAPAAPISRHLEVPASPDLGLTRDRADPPVRERASTDDRPAPKVPISGRPEIGGRHLRARGKKALAAPAGREAQAPPSRSRAHRRARAGAAGEAAGPPSRARQRQEALMRIVGGRLRGRVLAAPKSKAPKSDAIRPTADRLREALFNILVHAYDDPITGARVLDLFAGTGALGLEALSRGAAFALFVDDGAQARALIRENVAALGLGGVTRIFRRDATSLGAAHPVEPFSLVFLDPPYGSRRRRRWPRRAPADGSRPVR